MKHLARLGLAAALALPAAAIPAAAQDITSVNVINPLPRSANFYPILTGEALGYFEEEGVSVNLLSSDTSIPYVAFIQNGQADLAMLDPVETLTALNAGADITTVFEVMQNAPEGIAVSAESDVQGMEDLEGETVGLVSDRDRAFLEMALSTVDLSIDDVRTVVVGEGGPVLANAFRNQSVAAIAGSVPDWLAIQASGIGIRLITPQELLEMPANSFSMASDRVEELRPTLEGFFRAWTKGMYVGQIAPDITAEMAKRAVPEEWENEEFGREFLDASIDMNVSVTEQLGDLQPEVWADIQPRYVEVGVLDEEIDPSEFLDDAYIDAANDWDREEVEQDVEAWAEENM